MSLDFLTESLSADFQPYRKQAEREQRARENAALCREHIRRFNRYMDAQEVSTPPHGLSEGMCSCKKCRHLTALLSAYRKTARELRLLDIDLFTLERLEMELSA